MSEYILTLLVFVPIAGALLLLLVNKEKGGLIKSFAFVIALINFILSLYLYFNFVPENGFQFEVNQSWVQSLGINYHLGIDGISLFLVLLTTFLSSLAILSSWSAIQEKVKGYMVTMLFLEAGMIGVFVSLDLFLFYVFWEGMLIPMYFLIGIWGGPRKIYATIKFILFTMLGSIFMLVAILVLYFMNYNYTGEYSFDLLKILQLPIPFGAQFWLFLAFALAFAIKVPMFPFHTWLPDAHVEAPTAGSVLLAGVLLKMGTYGFLRFCLPLFPNAFMNFVPLFSILAIIGIIYGALVSTMQKDIKSLVAFSSVSHLGFVMLGLFALNMQGISGGILQMINHGISTGALFLIVGMIYERRHTRLIEEYGGIARVVPVFATFLIIVTLSSIGLPGTNGFVGEFLILLGAFKSKTVYAVLGAVGIILAAVYMLWMIQRVLFQEIKKEENKNLLDLNLREKITLIPIVLLIFWIGIYPQSFLSKIEPAVKNMLEYVNYKSEQMSSCEKKFDEICEAKDEPAGYVKFELRRCTEESVLNLR
ncbi:MAG: NADH-quinone oxidoreductase subunit M [candidate division Zixibacteria bacterium]|nr:NADH-quinone oxidoreductase subunit M [candidate division Zixibacteria bacterium]